MKSKLTYHQVKSFRKGISQHEAITVTIRYDDSCGNGHNSFSITGSITDSRIRGRDKVAACGCIHDEIIKHFPKYAHLIKWHLMSSDGPMHYIANSLYHASDRDYNGKLKGEPYRYETKVFFNDVPIPLKNYGQKFVKYMRSVIEKGEQLTILKFEHPDHGEEHKYQYGPKFTLSGCSGTFFEHNREDWYGCPFSDEQEANQVLRAFMDCEIKYVELPTAWGEGKTPDLEAARSSAIWPEAELEDFTEEKLKARLPALIKEFKTVIESLGMEF